ncbi:MAG TPA: hypothetical protein PKO36_05525, partial [Candidatus Hydrogenedentes bacterium]|nr:hypothetical protein [Candidatus Hydrogenedentota bacterium]
MNRLKTMMRVCPKGMAAAFAALCFVALTGCPREKGPELSVSEASHYFRPNETVWTFYVTNTGQPGTPIRFEAVVSAPW